MRESLKSYIEFFEKTLNLSNLCWWIIDFEKNPDNYYCNEFMEDTFSLDKNLPFHSVEDTCPIAGDYSCKTIKHTKIVVDEYKELINGKTNEYNNKFPYYDKKLNKKLYFSSQAKVLDKNEKNEVSILYGIITDITAQEEQRYEIEEYTNIINKYVITSETDVNGMITSVSDATCKISGYTRDELIGESHRLLRHPDIPNKVYKNLWETITDKEVWHGEFKNVRKNGTVYWVKGIVAPCYDENNNIKGYTSVREDITHKKIIEKLSKKDKLTNLYNRSKLDEVLQYEYEAAKRYDKNLSLIFIDIDYFKLVNDSCGHLVGDEVLVQFANLLKNNLRKSDLIGRWGGEEFIIICSNSNILDATQLAEKLRILIENFNFNMVKKKTASFGVTAYRKGDSIKSLLNRVDRALYMAKKLGRNRVEKS
ncbi:diguanylate cyclase [Sulfurimonas sp.]|uniref:sensor domain-containing diguanylate cyclase n=1 Tax=Sulfurimonas sp. TaxID=2022749 RepID=UPI002B45CBC3|nr:diguanylate cyclase [Sulfurimonas sp.]